MRRMFTFNILGALVFLFLISIFKITGYTIAFLFIQPAQFSLLVIPASLILYIFHLILTATFKPKSTFEKVYMILSLVWIHIISVLNIACPWIYITFGTALLNFTMSIVFITSIAFATMYIFQVWRTKEEINKNVPAKKVKQK